MVPKKRTVIKPFGDNAAEKEKNLEELYLEGVDFTKEALDPNISIIVGRRGAGKTALARYFRFDSDDPYDIYVDIDQPSAFVSFFRDVAAFGESQAHVIEDLAKTWELAFWTAIMQQAARHLEPRHEVGKCKRYVKSILQSKRVSKSSHIVREVLTLLSKKAGVSDSVELVYKIEEILSSIDFQEAQEELTAHLDRGIRVVIILDTLEQYELQNTQIRFALGAMLQAVNKFSLGEIHDNIHIKCFLPSEIFHYIDRVIPNVSKVLENPVYLHWTPKNLLRLSCLRITRYLQNNPEYGLSWDFNEIDWDDYQLVRMRVWDKLFGRTITNKNGRTEDSLQYIVRHTQLRPRQMIWILNSISQCAHKEKRFPEEISNDDIINGLEKVERSLSNEIFNSYQSVYPDARDIVYSSFNRQGPVLSTAKIDEYAQRSKGQWKIIPYDRHKFRRLAVETGVLGVIVSETDKFFEGEFEYMMEGVMNLSDTESCVIHPIFYKFLRIKPENKKPVYPLANTDLKGI